MADRLPYPGLRSFRRDEADLFFGREREEETLVDRLMGARFLGVLGASGCGKSSLVRTALFEALDGGYSRAGSNWRIAECHPGAAPFHNLARALAKVRPKGEYADSVAYIDRELRRGPRSIAQWCNENNLGPDEKLLIFVDQFEELFTTASETAPDEIDKFATVLVEASRAEDAKIYVVVTMRSDYFGACGAHPGLAEKIGEGIFLTPRMQRGQCAEAITGPADVIGFTIRDELLNRILNDMNRFADWEGGSLKREGQTGRQADQLPLMQYALNQMWLQAQRTAGKGAAIELTLKQYEEDVGGLEGALDRQGDQLIAKLAADGIEEIAVGKVFRALVRGPTIDLAVRDTRPIESIAAISGVDEAQVRQIVALFSAQDCLFLSNDGSDISLSHESLIRRWKKLRDWFVEEAEAAETLRELTRYTREWQARNEDRSELLEGRRLEQRRLFWASRRGNPAWIARHRRPEDPALEEISRFIDASTAKDRRTRRRRQMLVAGAAVGLIAVPGSMAYAELIKQRTDAERALSAAELANGQAKIENARAEAEAKVKLARAATDLAREAADKSELDRRLRDATIALSRAQLAQAKALAQAAVAAREKAVKNEATARNMIKDTFIGQLTDADSESMTTPRVGEVSKARSIFRIASILKDEDGVGEFISALSVASVDLVQDSIGVKYDERKAADALDNFAVSSDDSRGMDKEEAALNEGYRRARAGELRRKDLKSTFAEYKTLLDEADKSSADTRDAMMQRLNFRLGVLALARRDTAAATTYLRSCAEETDDNANAMRCLHFLTLAGGAKSVLDGKSIFDEEDIVDSVGEQGGNRPDAVQKDQAEFVATVYAIAAARASGKTGWKNLTPPGDFEKLAELYQISNDGNESAANLRAILIEAEQGPGEEGFEARRKILDAISSGYEPTTDFLIASEPSLLAVAKGVGEVPGDVEPATPIADLRRRPLPTREDFENAAERIATDAALLNGLVKLTERSAQLGSDGRSPKDVEDSEAVGRVARKMTADVEEFGGQFDRYTGFLQTALGFKIGEEPRAFSGAERERLKLLAEAVRPIGEVCGSKALAQRVPLCAATVARIAAFREATPDSIFMIDDRFLGQDPVEALRASNTPTRGLHEFRSPDPYNQVYSQIYFVSAKNKEDFEKASDDYRPELDGLAIDWLAVGQKWPGRIDNYCRANGKIYARAFLSGSRGEKCGDELKDALAFSETLGAAQPSGGSKDAAPTIHFVRPVDGVVLPMNAFTRVSMRIGATPGAPVVSPAPGRIGFQIRYDDGAGLAIPPCRTPDMKLAVTWNAKTSSFQLDGQPALVLPVICHADGSYSWFGGVAFDPKLKLGAWVGAGHTIGQVGPSTAKDGLSKTVSWYVNKDGLYNWDNGLKTRAELGIESTQTGKKR